MDEIRKFACELVLRIWNPNIGMDHFTASAKKIEEYLRSPVSHPVEAEDVSSEEVTDDTVFNLTEEQVLEAMLGDHPEAVDVMKLAQTDVGAIGTVAERIFDNGQ